MSEHTFGSLKKEIGEIKGVLNTVSAEKERLFKGKSEADRSITELIKKVKVLKTERDELTAKVKAAKEERAPLSREIKEKIAAFNEAKKKREATKGKHATTSNPATIEREIKALEYKIETEALPFEKEQKLTKIIKQKQKELDLASKNVEMHAESRTISKEIDALKKKSEELFRTIQENARESQKKHEELIAISKKIDDMKKERESLFEKFTEHKTTVKEASGKLKEKIGTLNQMNEQYAASREKSIAERKEKTEQILKEKENEVEEKLKKGKKLTAEDLLVFQAKNRN